MDQKESLKRSNLLKFEATMLFTQIKNQLESSRWFFFDEAHRQGFGLQLSQSISPYRASLHFRYVLCGVLFDAYLEREAHVGLLGENRWTLSFPGIEGKTHATLLRDRLHILRSEGYDVPNGDEYLDRQMNFSLGLFAACLMRVDVHFPLSSRPFDCFCHVMDVLDLANRQHSASTAVSVPFSTLEINSASTTDDDLSEDLMTGDWQTWK